MPADLVSSAEEIVEACKAVHERLAALYRDVPTPLLRADVTEIRMRFTELLAGVHEHVALCRAVQMASMVPPPIPPVIEPRPRAALAAGADGKSRAANDHTLDPDGP
ncbi:hypothetical protein [Verrucomicrobium spinosum]|uniref:hypothetical protein n=1 Tax=Verrucomicrobium spinosum TaxID=2736 RepID=UPI000174692B|nr:hypothetical protein [Verrucomicrobium spinosum]